MKTNIQICLLLAGIFLFTNTARAQDTTTTVETSGMASYYHDKFEGRPTASGELYRKDSLTAAHPTLPFNTLVKVTNLENQKSVVVRVNDRGPFVKSRIIDVSRAAATELDFIDKGVTRVEIELVSGEW